MAVDHELTRYLESLQTHWARRRGVPLQQGRVPVSEELIARMARGHAGELGLLNPGEDPVEAMRAVYRNGYTLTREGGPLEPVARSAASVLSPEESKQLADIPVGLIHQPLFNAASIAAPGGGFVVVLYYDLVAGCSVVFRNLFGLILALFHSPFMAIDTKLEIVFNFAMTLRRDLLGETGVQRGVAKLDAVESLRTFGLSITAEAFILLHEYGHILLGHLESDGLVAPHPCDSEELHAKYYSKSREQEFAADLWALERIERLKSNQPGYSSLDSLGMSLPMLFYSLHLCEELFGSQVADRGTHPEHLERLDRLLARLFGVTSRIEVPQANDLEKLCAAVLQTKEHLLAAGRGTPAP